MTNSDNFPTWIIDSVSKNDNKIAPISQEFFNKFLECCPSFYEVYLHCPKNSEMGVLTEHSPWILEDHFGKNSLTHFIVANVYEIFHYQYIYQVRELGITLHDALNKGMFYVASITLRAIFEIVCAAYYRFRRVENNFSESIKFLNLAAKTKSQVEMKRNYAKSETLLYQIFTSVIDSNAATSLNWSEHFKKLGYSEITTESSERFHVKTAIEDISKVSKLPLMEVYDVMSEFVHPNFGSKTLIVNTRKPSIKYMDIVVLGDNLGNEEAARYFIENLAESMYYTATLACSLHDRSIKFLNVLFDIVDQARKSQLH